MSMPLFHPDSRPHDNGYDAWSGRLLSLMGDPSAASPRAPDASDTSGGADSPSPEAEPLAVSWFAVIDPSVSEELPGLLWRLEPEPEVWPLFMNTMLREVALSGPLFVPLKPGGAIARWFFDMSRHSAAGVVYKVEADKSALLFEHLQNLVECVLPGGGRGIFRFTDPRVLHALDQLPDPGPRASAVGPALCLHAWEPGRELAMEIKGPGPVLEKESPAVSQEVLDAVSDHTSPYAVINKMTGERGERLRALPLPEAFAGVDAVCRALYSLGFRAMYDLLLGVSACMQLNRNIFVHEPVRLFMASRKPGETLSDMLQRMPQDRLDEAGGV